MAKCAICDKGTGTKNRLIITRSNISNRNPRPEKAQLELKNTVKKEKLKFVLNV